MFDIIKKLKQEDFFTSLRIHGQIKTLFAGLSGAQDPLIQSALIFMLGILAKDLRNLEGLVGDSFMAWVVTSLEKHSKHDILITLPKKRYERTIVQEFIFLVKDYDLGITTSEPLLMVAAKAIGIKSADFIFIPSEPLADFLKKANYEKQ